jgi:hypothetical protein
MYSKQQICATEMLGEDGARDNGAANVLGEQEEADEHLWSAETIGVVRKGGSGRAAFAGTNVRFGQMVWKDNRGGGGGRDGAEKNHYGGSRR